MKYKIISNTVHRTKPIAHPKYINNGYLSFGCNKNPMAPAKKKILVTKEKKSLKMFKIFLKVIVIYISCYYI